MNEPVQITESTLGADVIVMARGVRVALIQPNDKPQGFNVFVGTQPMDNPVPGEFMRPIKYFDRYTNCFKRFRSMPKARQAVERFLLEPYTPQLEGIWDLMLQFRHAIRDMLTLHRATDVMAVLNDPNFFLLLPPEYAGNREIHELMDRVNQAMIAALQSKAYMDSRDEAAREIANQINARRHQRSSPRITTHCTKAWPAQSDEAKRYWRHLDAVFEVEVDEIHGDERWRCPHCGYSWIKEGPDY